MAPSLVQTKATSGAAVTSLSATLSSGTTSGNNIIAYVILGATGSSGITTTRPTGWLLAKNESQSSKLSVGIHYLENVGSGVTSWSWTFSASCDVTIILEEWSGLATSSSLDVTASSTVTTTSAVTGTTAATGHANELVVWCLGYANSGALTYSSIIGSYTASSLNTASSTGAPQVNAAAWNNVVSATGTQNSGCTLSATPSGAGGRTSCVIATFIIAGGSTVNGSATLEAGSVLQQLEVEETANSAATEAAVIVAPASVVGNSALQKLEVFETANSVETATQPQQLLAPASEVANSAIAESAVVIVTTANDAVANSVLAVSAQVIEAATAQANSVATQTDAFLLAPDAPTGNSVISQAAKLVTSGTNFQANSGITAPAQLLAPAGEVANSLLSVTGTANTYVAGNSAMAVSAMVIAPADATANTVVTESAQLLEAATAQSSSVFTEASATILASPAEAANSGIVVNAQLLTPGAAFHSNTKLGVVAQLLATPAAAVANSATAESAQLDAPATLVSSGVMHAQPVAQAFFVANSTIYGYTTVLAPVVCTASSSMGVVGTVMAATVIMRVLPAQVLTSPFLVAQVSLTEGGKVQAPCPVVAASGLAVSGVVLAPATLTSQAAVATHAALVEAATLVANSLLTKVVVRGPLKTTFSFSQALYAAFSPKQALSAAFVASQHLAASFSGSPPVPNPFSTLTMTATVTDANNNPLANLSAVSVVVTFPDGSTQTFSLAGTTVTNLGAGKYAITYNTKGVGETTEVWNATAIDGVTLGSFENVVPVTY